jgi:hypothetical protein
MHAEPLENRLVLSAISFVPIVHHQETIRSPSLAAGDPVMRIAILILALAAFALTTSSANAEFIITIQEQGPDVKVTGSGTIDTFALTPFPTTAVQPAQLTPNVGSLSVGVGNAATLESFTGFSGPSNFGPGLTHISDSATGDYVALIIDLPNVLTIPTTSPAGSPLSDAATYNNSTLSSLGLTPGTYDWTWGSGAHADSLELRIEQPVPEPSTLVMSSILLGVFGVGGLRKCLKKTTAPG